MATLNTEFEVGTFGQDDYDVIQCTVDYDVTPYVPERAYLSNGDPGYPAEGGEIEEIVVTDETGKDITATLTQATYYSFVEQAYADHLKNKF